MSPFSRALVTSAPYSVWVILLVVVTASAQTNQAQSGSMTAIIGVNVIPMDEDRVLKDQTVIIADGRITEIGNTREVTVPDAAKRIDGNNRYLMPGLADLHTHLRGADE